MLPFRKILALKCLATLVLVTASAVASVPETDPLSDWVIDGDFAYGMMQPEAAAPSGAEQIEWSGDASKLIVVRRERTPDAHLADGAAEPIQILSQWDRRTARSTEILRLPGDGQPQITPLGGSSAMLVNMAPATWLLDTSTARVTALAGPNGFRLVGGVDLSPRANRFAVSFAHETGGQGPESIQWAARVYGLNGAVLAEALMPGLLAGPQWTPEGWPVYQTLRHRGETRPSEAYVLRPNVGFVPYSGPIAEDADGSSAAGTGPHLSSTAFGQLEGVYSLWLEGATKSEMSRALVCAESSGGGDMSPHGDAVAYISRGVPLVRRILKLPKSEFLKLMQAAKKRRAMNNAKQAATAIEIYMADSDDALPLNGNFFEAVMPYIKNASILSSFVYTYGGGEFPKDADPSKIEIGYVQGDGGRAVAFGDGHVEWKPDAN